MRKKTQEEFIKDVHIFNPNINVIGIYINNATKVKVQCMQCGRVWDAVPTMITKKYECHLCRKQKEFEETLRKENIVNIDSYVDNFTSVRVECNKCKYIWSVVPKQIKRNTVCPNCQSKITRRKWNEDTFKAAIAVRNPQITVLDNYRGYEEKLNCVCKMCNYKFSQSAHQLLQGRGCPNCNGHRSWTEAEYITELNKINPNIIAKGFKGRKKKISCECVICGCTWKPQADDLLRGHGCPRCTGHEKVDTNKFRKEFNEKNSYIKIMDDEIENSTTMFRCKCKRCGNIWYTNINRLKQGNGCILCNHSATSFMEQSILLSFRMRLGNKNVLSRNKSTIGKELDIYIPSKKIAFEPGSWNFHKNSQHKDSLKRQLCLDKGIRLISIFDSYTASSRPYEENCYVYEIELGAPQNRSILRQLINELFVIADVEPLLSEREWDEIQVISNEKSMRKNSFEILKDMKKANPHLIFHDKPTRVHEPINCECKVCGWKWKSTPLKIIKGHGCPECAGTRKLSQDEFLNDLKRMNPNIIPLEEYININTPIKFKCSTCDYEWTSKPRGLIRFASRCPSCNKYNRVLEMLEKRHDNITNDDKDIIKRFSRKNPSSKYNTEEFKWLVEKINSKIEVLGEYVKIDENIECKCRLCGNKWSPRAQHILNGHGCPNCKYVRNK